MSNNDIWEYERLRDLVRGEALPLMLVDLDVLDENTRRLARVAADHGKNLRVASKSVRVPELLTRIAEVGGEHMRGLMCFSVPEAKLLAAHGFDDLLIAYPTVQASDLEILWELTQEGRIVTLMIDEPAQVDIVGGFWDAKAGGKSGAPLRVCIDLDVSLQLVGQHVGVQRSPVRNVDDFAALLEVVLACPQIRLAGVMAYEALIAGVADENPFAPLLNSVKKALKRRSVADVADKRRAVAELLASRGIELDFFNGGGSGSIKTTSVEDCVTEVTAGSGFLQSHLFDYYEANENRAAFCFALQATRVSQPGMITCQSGGFIASGETTADKAPLPFRPAGVKTNKTEGCGEVQTPLLVPSELRGLIKVGDPVFFRPAKAGEIAERFNEYLLKRGGKIVGRAKTYRGLGHCFY